VLRVLGEREGNVARLEEAIAAFRASLEGKKRKRVPLDWAMATVRLATAELSIARLPSTPAKGVILAKARVRVVDALEVFRGSGAQHYVEHAEQLLPDIEAEITKHA
jgi:hypothetical protein